MPDQIYWSFIERLLLYPQNRVLSRLGNTKFDYGFGRDFNLLLSFRIEARACFPLLFHQLAKTWQDEFTVLLNLLVSERTERLEKYSGGSFVGFGGSSERDLKFSFGHVYLLIMAGVAPFQRESLKLSSPLLTLFGCFRFPDPAQNNLKRRTRAPSQ
jgi:hypothetical protein